MRRGIGVAVVNYQLWPITHEQQADEDARMAQTRERRDRETPG